MPRKNKKQETTQPSTPLLLITAPWHIRSRKNRAWIRCEDEADEAMAHFLEHYPPVEHYIRPVCESIVFIGDVEYNVPLDFIADLRDGSSLYVFIARTAKPFPDIAYIEAVKALKDPKAIMVVSETRLCNEPFYGNLKRLYRWHNETPLNEFDLIDIEVLFLANNPRTIGDAKDLLDAHNYDPKLVDDLIFYKILCPNIESSILSDSTPIVETCFKRWQSGFLCQAEED